MRIVFMGTTDFAQASLQALLEAGHEVCAVCTKPDRARKRGMKLTGTPVKEEAEKAGIPVLQPETLKSLELQEQLRSFGAELFVVVAYGKLLPSELLHMPKYGCVNVHGSLLPAYRGAAPIQWAVLNGDRETGVTTMLLDEGMDSGAILKKAALPIEPCESFGSVYEKLMKLGAELLLQTVDGLRQGTIVPEKQDEALVSYAPPITKDFYPIDWSMDAARIAAHICGLSPKPGATAEFGGVIYKLFAPLVLDETSEAPCGTVAEQGKNGLKIVCGDGKLIRIRELQAPGGKRMEAAAYLRGHKLV